LPFYVYIFLCDDGSYYTGFTKDVVSSVKQHRNGVGARYTRMHKPKRVVYVKEFDTLREAMKREREIKQLNREEKIRLVSPQRDD
jgi:putative endonuclease